MPISLTTPISPGDLDPGKTYTHAKIDWFAMLVPFNKIELVVAHGYLDGPTFVKSALKPLESYTVQGADYVTMVQKLPLEGETIYTAAARELYEWLIAQGHIVGTVV